VTNLVVPRGGVIPVADGRVRARRVDSLRWRLPLLFGALIVIMLGTFIWAMSRAVHGTLVDAGHERARASAGQVAGWIETSIAATRKATGRIQSDTTLQAALRNPTAQSLGAARALLSPLSPPPRAGRTELWDARGNLLLAITKEPTDSTVRLRAYPAGGRPTGPEISEIKALGNSNYMSAVIEIRGDSSRREPPLGYLRLFSVLSVSPKGIVQNLIGDSATMKIGSTRGGVWTDIDRIVNAPPAHYGPTGSGEYRASDGTRWIGAEDPIEGTPWMVWVGFPRAMIVAPANPFMDKMILLALLFIAGGAALAVLLGIRLTQPLHELAHAAEQIAAGDYSRRVAAHGRDEIGRLGDAFNTMTDRIEDAYTALRKSHEQTQFALAAARIGVWESHISSRSIRCSASMHLLHRLPQGLLPETCDEFLNSVHDDDREMVGALLNGSSMINDEFDVEYRANGPGGSLHWMQSKGRLIRGLEGEPVSVLGVSIDITERRRLEAQFRQSHKMEAIGQLAGGIAHDFNNILTAIIGYGGLLLIELDGKSELQSDVGSILKAAESAAKMTHQLLAFSRGQVLRPEVIDVNAVIADTEKLLTRLIGPRIAFVTELASDIHPVKVDAAQLQQVLMNLAINARDAMPRGGKLSIASSNVLLDEAYRADHAEVAPGEHVMIMVSDTGDGMDAETQARLFEPFFTTKAPGEGTGLGLATVYGIVKQSGGHIFVYSEPGHGTTFRVYFPAANDSAAEVPREIAEAPATVVDKDRILVVDDNVVALGVAKTILERLGYIVLTAGSGAEALEVLKKPETRPRLLLTDVFLPGMTGPELYREVAALYPEIRAVFMSGYSPGAITPHAVFGPGFIFVEKPYNATTLGSRVRQALGEQLQ
jgi:signal transduction histidine kinase/CheY-like chemotaxis protein